MESSVIAGHFATALVARQHAPRGSLLFFLVISQLPDLMWQVFHFLGLEPTAPANPMSASLQSMQVEMTYSHDLLPTLGWIALAIVAGRALFGTWRTGWMAGALIVAHAACDALSGHPHFLFGPDTHQIGLGLYKTAPYLALAIEAAFTLVVMIWVLRTDAKAGVRRSRATLVVWAAVLGGGIVALIPIADRSVAELLGIAPVDALAGMLIPGLVVQYLCMLGALLWADARPTVSATGA
ncbi:MAG: hypothetical protein ACI9U2_000842 [Bradymonadia bacterium]|jgi:hypothetical protein